MNRFIAKIRALSQFLLLSTVPFIGVAQAADWTHKDWSVVLNDGLVKYTTHGHVVHGHEFGFVRLAGQCETDLPWYSWSSYEVEADQATGALARIAIKIDGIERRIRARVVHSSVFVGSLRVVMLTSEEADEALIDRLARGRNLSVKLAGPQTFVNLFDITSDKFSLNGFVAARLKAKELCLGLKEPSV